MTEPAAAPPAVQPAPRAAPRPPQPAAAAPPAAAPPAPAPVEGGKQTKKVAFAVLGFVAILLGIHLFANRLTPYTEQARVRAYVVPVAPEVGGTVTKVHVTNNQIVRRGAPLFTLGTDAYLIAAQKAQADISAVMREQQAQDAAIVAARANLSAAEADRLQARQDNARLEAIWREDQGAISLRRLEISRAGLAAAESRVVAAEAQVAQARAARGPLDANNDRLIAARSALDKAELDIRRTTVFAPTDGLVTDLSAEVGKFAGAGSPVMTFISATDVWIDADMTENNIGLMQKGNRAEIVLDSNPGKVLPGKVRSIGFGVAAGSGTRPGSPLPTVQNDKDFLRSAQRFPVIVALDDPRAALPYLREGGQADVLVYNREGSIMNPLARLYIRLMSYLSYAY